MPDQKATDFSPGPAEGILPHGGGFQPLAPAVCRQSGMQQAVFRHEQIKILGCPYLKGAVTQHGPERIGRLEAGKLQYPFINGKDHGPARALCPHFHRQIAARAGPRPLPRTRSGAVQG